MTDRTRDDDANVAQQLEEIIDLANEMPGGPHRYGNQKKMAEAMGVSRWTIYRSLKPLVEQMRETNPEKFLEGRLTQKAVYELMEEALVSGKIEPDVARAWQSIRDSISRLMGYDSPSKSVHVSVTANTAVQYRFLERAHGLTADQIESVFKFMDALPRASVSIAGCYPKQLTEGEVVADLATEPEK
jgi:hypothetical protein